MSARNARLVKHKLQSIPHPKDRKIDQLQRQMRHNFKLDGYKDRRKQHDQLTAARFFWFRCQIEGPLADQPDSFYTPEVLEALMLIHIDRNDEEIAELKKETRKTKIQHGRINMLEEQKKYELQLFGTKGLPAPDLCDKETREIMLEIWDGDGKLVNCVPTINVIRQDRPNMDTLKAELRALLASIDEVRDAQEAAGVVSSKSAQFRREAPDTVREKVERTQALAGKLKSVKSGQTGDQIVKAGVERRLLQLKKRQSLNRHIALSRSRGLM